MLTVTDSDGNSVQLDVKEIANNATFVTELSNNNTLITNIVNKLAGKYGNVVYNATEDQFYYIKVDGTQEPIDWTDLNTINESFTLENDQLVITDSDGNSVELSLADIASNKIFVEHIAINQNFITKLGDNTDFIDIIINKLEGKFGNVGFDVNSQKLFYYDEDYNIVFIEWKDIFEANETITTIEKDSLGNGKYIYTNEADDVVVIDIPAEVINNFEKIIENSEVINSLNTFITYNGYVKFDGENFTYVNQNGDVVMISIGDLVRMHETVTTLTNVDGVLTYTNEAKTEVKVDIPALIADNETVTTLNDVDGVITYTNEENIAVTVDIPALVTANETLTTLKNVEAIEENEDGDEIKTYTLTYTDEAGAENPIDIEVLVRGHETITSLEYDPANYILTYTNEAGQSTILKLKELVEGGESLTKLEFDTATNSLLYTDENQVIHTIEIDAINKHPWLNSSTHKIATNPNDNIYTKGWVGIGFTEPSSSPSEKLRVNGSITAVNSYYADYVFENYFDGYSALKYDYKFNSLDVVEDFIKTNRHLPGITPIHELNKTEEGYAINVSELSVQLLEKTEELYLHIIDQNKALEEKEARIKELEQANQSVQQKVEQLEQMVLEFMQKN
ncbi:hypothetical protein H4K33_13195 [Myroides sp. WP-1]|nr:hypothetical protein [Myroides sp. WP-1]